MALRMTNRVDLDVYYDADVLRASGLVRGRVTREVFKAFYAACPSVGFECDGQPIGGVIFDGESAHIAVLASHHGRWARLLKPMLSWLFGLRKEIIVRLDDDNHKGLAFMERCGWPRLHKRGGEVFYRMTPDGAHAVARVTASEAPAASPGRDDAIRPSSADGPSR